MNLSEVLKPVGGAAIGVTVPLVTEYVAKGKRLGATTEEPTRGVKWSGIVGLVEGGVGIGGAAYDHYVSKRLAPEDKAFLGALGGAGLATGGGIIILDELRKRKLYEFAKARKAGKVPPKTTILAEEGLEGVVPPTMILIEEI